MISRAQRKAGGVRAAAPPAKRFVARDSGPSDRQAERSGKRSPLSAALGLFCRRFATAGNKTLGRWGLPPPHHRFPQRPACRADGTLKRAKNIPAFRCARHVLQTARCRRQRTAWQLGAAAPKPPIFRCARLVLQKTRYRGQRSAWQVGAANPTPPLSAALGLSFRRLATACNETLVVLARLFAAETYNDKTFLYSPPPPRWYIAFIVVGDKKNETSLTAALGFTCGVLAAAGNERDHDGRAIFSRRRANEMAVEILASD